MGRYRIELPSTLPADEAFHRLVDLDAHTAVIPLTTLRHTPPLQAGSRFTARTAVGPVGFDDSMLVREYAEPGDGPGRAVFVKTGRWVTGESQLTVASTEGGSHVVWQQDIAMPWLPGFVDPVVTQVARQAYTMALRRLLARA